MDLSAHFMELSPPLNASITIQSYSILIDTGYFFRHFIYFNTGYLTTWTLYGTIRSSNGTTPIFPSDPSWMILDIQYNIDFSNPQDFHNPGLFTYTIVNGASVSYQYFKFVTTLIPPTDSLEAAKPYANPVLQVDFCS